MNFRLKQSKHDQCVYYPNKRNRLIIVGID